MLPLGPGAEKMVIFKRLRVGPENILNELLGENFILLLAEAPSSPAFLQQATQIVKKGEIVVQFLFVI